MNGTRGPLPSQELAQRANAELEGASAQEVLAWAARTFGHRLAVAASMADTVLVHLAQRALPGVHVIFLDTGYHFPQTLETRDAVERSYAVHLINVLPRQTVAEQDAEFGARLYERNPDRCCHRRKVQPLDQVLTGYAAWATGLRRTDSTTRTETPVVDWDQRRGLVKINPIVAWEDQEIEDYIEQHQVIVNPLLSHGYPSIGCEPCTRPVAPGQHSRSGRWTNREKTECGLHSCPVR